MKGDYIKELQGKEFRKIGRASNLCWMHFGETVITKDYKGVEREVGKYAIHLQSPWRIKEVDSERIIIASGDLYEPNSLLEWTEEFDWDIKGNNLFDEKINYWHNKWEAMYVENVTINKLGDLQILFSNGIILESFMDMSIDEEGWRFFECGTGKEHMVCAGTEIRFE